MNQEWSKKSISPKWLYWFGGIFIFIILIAVLAVDEGNLSESSQSEQKENNTEQAASWCLDVPVETLLWVESGLVADNLSLEGAHAVRSDDFSEVYFISAYIRGGGLSGDSVTTFAANNINGSGLVLAVSAHAKEFTDWFHGDKEGAQYYVTMNNHGARESRDCISR